MFLKHWNNFFSFSVLMVSQHFFRQNMYRSWICGPQACSMLSKDSLHIIWLRPMGVTIPPVDCLLILYIPNWNLFLNFGLWMGLDMIHMFCITVGTPMVQESGLLQVKSPWHFHCCENTGVEICPSQGNITFLEFCFLLYSLPSMIYI